MSAKFTPGPWFGVAGMVEVQDDNKADICSCYASNFGQGSIGRPRQEEWANARLISAAPDLLYALKNILGSIEIHDDRAVDIALNAIAKAEGI
jgi:hypothetical protein